MLSTKFHAWLKVLHTAEDAENKELGMLHRPVPLHHFICNQQCLLAQAPLTLLKLTANYLFVVYNSANTGKAFSFCKCLYGSNILWHTDATVHGKKNNDSD